jgi:hypothetical protein
MYGVAGFAPGAPGANLFNEDVADEDAFKVAALYHFSTRTTVGGIFEMMHRYVAPDLQFQNERSRNGTWLFVSQELTDIDSIHFGWAHAFTAQGDPGQHNSSTLTTADGGGLYAPDLNAADMITASYKRKLSPNLTWYTAVAATFNGSSAHYDLGAGGRGVTTDWMVAMIQRHTATPAPRLWAFRPALPGGSRRRKRSSSANPLPVSAMGSLREGVLPQTSARLPAMKETAAVFRQARGRKAPALVLHQGMVLEHRRR